jgi:hypothetical protein
MDAASTLPQCAAYIIGGLAVVCGAFLVFVLGLVANAVQKRSGTGENKPSDGQRDCSNCPSIQRVETGLAALNQRIDRILELRGGIGQ